MACLADFVPELIELGVVRAVFNVAQFMEHRVKDLLEGEEVPVPVGPPKPELHLGASTHV